MKIILALVTFFLFGFALFSSAFADKNDANMNLKSISKEIKENNLR